MHIKDVLEEHFPRLKSQNGAFELRKATFGGVGSRPLTAFSSTSRGYSVTGLKEEAKSSTVYVVPLNCHISTEPLKEEDLQDSSDVEFVICNACRRKIPLLTFKDHKDLCQIVINVDDTKEIHEMNPIERLKEMFPDKPDNVLEEALEQRDGDLNNTVADIISEEPCSHDDEDPVVLEYPSIISQDNDHRCTPEASLSLIQRRISGEEFKLKVDEEDVFADALTLYKDGDFDPCKPYFVRFNGQPGIDQGGVMKQYFAGIFTQMVTGADGLKPIFEGEPGYLLPVYDSSLISSKMMEYTGKIFAHGIAMASTGPRLFSKVIFNYLCTGELDYTLVSLNDATSKTRHFVQELENLDSNEISGELVEVCEEAGITISITPENKAMISEQLVIHDIC
ncbi:uncharacterized protein [Clytia hemisphaerica]|uniref:uncharacterized protein n=1 Tax=Clytia hemisphaerica TaxID=252671 RepID=UPI0034D6E67C